MSGDNLNPGFDFSGMSPEYPEKRIENDTLDTEINELAEAFKNSDDTPQAGTFPLYAFPQALQEIVMAANEGLSFPVEFTAAGILYAASLAIGNTHKIRLREGHNESAVLYMAIVGRAGTNKSHPVTFAIKPLQQRDQASYYTYRSEQTAYDQYFRKPENHSTPGDKPSKPFWIKYLVTDFTPEALALVHSHNKRSIGVYVDELAGWFNSFNRYHKGNEQESWLSIWSGKPISIDRKTSEPVYIAMPFISVIGTIQNAILDNLAKDNRGQNGFIDRILFVMPDLLEKPYWNEKEMATEYVDRYNQIITRLLDLPFEFDDKGVPIPVYLTFSPLAKSIFIAWYDENVEKYRAQENDALASIYVKLEIYLPRIALILQMLRWACREDGKEVIEEAAIKGAIAIVEYFRRTACKVHATIANHSPLDKLPSNKRRVYETLPEVFEREIGLQIAMAQGLSRPTFDRFIANRALFKKLKAGTYEKLL